MLDIDGFLRVVDLKSREMRLRHGLFVGEERLVEISRERTLDVRQSQREFERKNFAMEDKTSGPRAAIHQTACNFLDFSMPTQPSIGELHSPLDPTNLRFPSDSPNTSRSLITGSPGLTNLAQRSLRSQRPTRFLVSGLNSVFKTEMMGWSCEKGS